MSEYQDKMKKYEVVTLWTVRKVVRVYAEDPMNESTWGDVIDEYDEDCWLEEVIGPAKEELRRVV